MRVIHDDTAWIPKERKLEAAVITDQSVVQPEPWFPAIYSNVCRYYVVLHKQSYFNTYLIVICIDKLSSFNNVINML